MHVVLCSLFSLIAKCYSPFTFVHFWTKNHRVEKFIKPDKISTMSLKRPREDISSLSPEDRYKRFIRAVKYDDVKTVRACVAAGQDVNQKSSFNFAPVPIYTAIQNRCGKVVEYLIQCPGWMQNH